MVKRSSSSSFWLPFPPQQFIAQEESQKNERKRLKGRKKEEKELKRKLKFRVAMGQRMWFIGSMCITCRRPPPEMFEASFCSSFFFLSFRQKYEPGVDIRESLSTPLTPQLLASRDLNNYFPN